MNRLMHIFEAESRKIINAFKEASLKHSTPDDIAVSREEAVKTFLEFYLPISYRIGKGQIIDKKPDSISTQIDCIVCTPYHPYTFKKNERGVFFAEGVGAAIEVKPDITDLRELRRGIDQIQSVKKLERGAVEGCIMSGNEYEQVKWRKIPSFLFSVKSAELAVLKSNINFYFIEQSIVKEEQPDAFIILEKGIIFNIKDERDGLHIETDEGRKLGLVGCEFGNYTLFQFLLCLSREMPAEIQFRSILTNYNLEKIGCKIV